MEMFSERETNKSHRHILHSLFSIILLKMNWLLILPFYCYLFLFSYFLLCYFRFFFFCVHFFNVRMIDMWCRCAFNLFLFYSFLVVTEVLNGRNRKEANNKCMDDLFFINIILLNWTQVVIGKMCTKWKCIKFR